MKEQLKELLRLLYEKYEKEGLTSYEEGIKDVVDLIESEDGYGIDELISELK